MCDKTFRSNVPDQANLIVAERKHLVPDGLLLRRQSCVKWGPQVVQPQRSLYRARTYITPNALSGEDC